MPLFICAKCGCVENTALSTYWFRENLKYTGELEQYQDRPLCSECGMRAGKTMIPGHWHNQFPKRLPTEEEKKTLKQ